MHRMGQVGCAFVPVSEQHEAEHESKRTTNRTTKKQNKTSTGPPFFSDDNRHGGVRRLCHSELITAYILQFHPTLEYHSEPNIHFVFAHVTSFNHLLAPDNGEGMLWRPRIDSHGQYCQSNVVPHTTDLSETSHRWFTL